MEDENVILVNDIHKYFKVFYDKGSTLKEKVLFRNRRRFEKREVLKGVSFSIKKGEAVGLIGKNGCGKSTTLKLLTKIMYPDSGNIQTIGRVSSLIELGAGFHPDMSGRQNIYTNASIFGLARKEIDDKLEKIIAFSELQEFIDNPVRTYSSGMYMRLAFSIAINVDADILLIDEILAVGDANFQAKCFNKLREIKANGTTIVIVSHSLPQIEQICDRSIWIHEGKIRLDGKPGEIHPYYMDYMMNGERKAEEKSVQNAKPDKEVKQNTDNNKREVPSGPKEIGNRDVVIEKVAFINKESKEEQNEFVIGSDIELLIKYKRNNPDLKETGVGFHFFRNDGVDCYGTNTIIDKKPKALLSDEGEIRVVFNRFSLLRGKYAVDIAFHNELGTTYHYVFKAIVIEIKDRFDDVGVARIEHKWSYNGSDQ